MIWGTNINVPDAMDRFKRFINQFVLEEEKSESDISDDEDEEKEPYYLSRLNEIRISQVMNLNVDCKHLFLVI